MNIFNLFITYGDTFLPSPNSYDQLYYEVIRMHQVFDNLYSMGKLHRTTLLLLLVSAIRIYYYYYYYGSVVRASVSDWRTFPDMRLIYG